jgi:wyosine [tRNA(Phe)-imidazoG37] synthetase (radical SAM superfamily)
MQSASTHTSSVTGTLRALEKVLLRRGQRTARRNAWNAVLEDRRRARDRRDTELVMRTTATRGVRHP